MKTANRSAAVVRPKEPYLTWANGFDDGGPKLDPADPEECCRAFLIPEFDDPERARGFVAENCVGIFTEMLESWMNAPETWPALDIRTFQEWFDLEILEPVFDLGDEKIVSED